MYLVRSNFLRDEHIYLLIESSMFCIDFENSLICIYLIDGRA